MKEAGETVFTGITLLVDQVFQDRKWYIACIRRGWANDLLQHLLSKLIVTRTIIQYFVALTSIRIVS